MVGTGEYVGARDRITRRCERPGSVVPGRMRRHRCRSGVLNAGVTSVPVSRSERIEEARVRSRLGRSNAAGAHVRAMMGTTIATVDDGSGPISWIAGVPP
jgi:hypothetical protein